jgi:ribonuclease VapC
MVIDTSVLIAILLKEPEALCFMRTIVDSEKRVLSAFSLLEASLVILARKGEPGLAELNKLLQLIKVEIVAFDAQQAALAVSAWQQFGKGQHAAKLNIGDCCVYALSRQLGEPLLFKGGDFAQTDLEKVDHG